MAGASPNGAHGKPDEIAAVVNFSPDRSFVTGQSDDAGGGRATY
jgi:hypothetical protein